MSSKPKEKTKKATSSPPHADMQHGTADRKNNKENPKGNPCEFIFPPNLLLAKVTHDPAMTEVRAVKKGKFVFDQKRLAKMSSIIEKNQSVCLETLNEKVKELEPLYEKIKNGIMPVRADIIDMTQHVNTVSQVLDHIPVSRITSSLLKYLTKLPAKKELSSSILITHFDALFNRETLNVKLDAPTKMVLVALEALTDHALLSSS